MNNFLFLVTARRAYTLLIVGGGNIPTTTEEVMPMKWKRPAAFLMAVIACITVLQVGAVCTSAPSHAVPFWDNTSTITCNLAVNGTTATCKSRVTGISGTSKITGTLTLYKQTGSSWLRVNSWSNTSSYSVLSFSEEITVAKGYNYKLVVRAIVTHNGSNEEVEKESAVKYCG